MGPANAPPQRAWLAVLAEAGQVLAGSLDVREALEAVAALATRSLADGCAVDILALDGETLERAVVRTREPAPESLALALQRGHPSDPPSPLGVDAAGAVHRDGRPRLLHAVAEAAGAAGSSEPDACRMPRELGLRSAVTVPLQARGQRWGVLTLVTARGGRRYDEEDLRLAEDLARRCGMALAAARLDQRAQEATRQRDRARAEGRRAQEQVAVLLQASRLLDSTLQPAAAPAGILDLARRLVTADAYALWRLDEAACAWRVAAAHGLSAAFTEVVLPGSERWVAPEGPLVIEEVADLARLEHRPHYEADGIQSLLVVPLLLEGGVRGTLGFYSRSARRFSRDDQAIASALATLAGTALTAADLQAEQQRRGHELAQAEQRYRELVHGVDAIVWEADADTWRFTFVSEQAERILGYPPRRWLEQDLWQAIMHPDDRERVVATCREALRATGEASFRYRARAADGRAVWLQATLRVVQDPAGGAARLRGLLVDVTERVRAEEALREGEELLRSVLDSVVDGIITIDGRGRIESCNPATERIFGYERDELIGANVKLLMPPPYRDEHDRYLRAYLETGIRRIIGRGREVLGRRKGGATFPLELSVSEVRLGERRLFTGVVRDITARKRLEAALLERADQLIEADRRKDEFLALLGHELRNPLAPIRNALDVLRRTSDPTRGERARAIMERQVVHMARLLDDLLDVSRITRGKLQVRPRAVPLQEVVQHAVDAARSSLAGRVLTIDLPADPLWAEADPDRLEQVVTNLLSNAMRYTPPEGRIEVRLAARADPDADPGPVWAELRVRDTGVGMRAEDLRSIFEPFTQLGRTGITQMASSQGLGIGLTLVRELVRLHGGQVEAVSEGPGRGSEFVVRLPLLAEAAPTPARAETSPAPAPSRRVLLVDDNVDSTEALAEVLSLSGHEVRGVYDGAAALALAPEFAPHVVVLDIGLPDMSGYDVARALRAAGLTEAQLIGLSGFGAATDRARGREAGLDHYLLKPVSLRELEALLAEA